MKTRFDNKLKAVGASLEELTQNLPLLSTVPAVKETYDEILEKYEALREKAKHQSRDITGFTKAKDNTREDLINATLSVAGAVHALAARRKLKDLLPQVDFTYAMLDKSTLADLSRHSKRTLDHAEAYTGDLKNYGITEPMLDDLRTKLATYDKAVAVSRDTVVDRTVMTKDLPDDFREIDELFDSVMDKQMELFRLSHPEFYRRYFASRKIVDYGIRHEPDTMPADGQPSESPMA